MENLCTWFENEMLVEILRDSTIYDKFMQEFIAVMKAFKMMHEIGLCDK